MISTIYEPAGRAKEYSHLALNLMTGCSFACSYCYCPDFLHIPREQFHSRVQPRKGIIDALSEQAPRFSGTNKRVLLNFVGDPFCPQAIKAGVTREALEILRGHDIPFQTLSKAGLAACRFLDLYRPGMDTFAVTLTVWRSDDSVRYEPRAALPKERIESLVQARDRSIETWVSLEPVLEPEQSLELIKATASAVDLFKIGTLNHAKSDTDWRDFGFRAIDLCERLGKRYYIKQDLVKRLQGIRFHNSDNRTIDWREAPHA